MKRVISGVFLLIALGALGLILAGALTSGEQLIVRFLTAVIVAALALYVISDLRLQADDSAVANRGPAKGPRPPAVNPARVLSSSRRDAPPPNSTAAFMATVTGRRSAAPLAAEAADPADDDPTVRSVSFTLDAIADPVGAESEWARPSVAVWPVPGGVDEIDPAGLDEPDLAESLPDPSAYLVRAAWAATCEPVTVATAAGSGEAPAEAASAGFETGEIEGLVAMFSREAPATGAVDGELAFDGVDADDDDLDDEGDGGDEIDPEPGLPELALAGAGQLPGPGGTSPFGRLASPAGGLGLLDRPASEVVTLPVTTLDQPPASTGTAGTDTALAASTIAAAAYTRAPLADIVDLRPRPVAPRREIEAAIRSGELGVIASLIGDGLLSTEGPISDRDVRTMVYVAFTSSELRKILLAGGTIDGDNSSIDLGPVEVFHRPSLAAAPSQPAPPVRPGSPELTGTRDVPEVIDLTGARPELTAATIDLRVEPAQAL